MKNQIEMNALLAAIREAGTSISRLFKTDIKTTHKENNDPLTEADILSNTILQKHLLKAFPQYGWLSEETVDNQDRLKCERVWVVDPIDGTKEFVQGIPEYAISAALVENGKPILGAVYNPMTQELFYAMKDQGAWLNRSTIQCNCPYQGKLKLLASRTEIDKGEWSNFVKKTEVRAIGSIAYKLALIASGAAHSTFSLGPKSEWDIAAGVLLIQEAGGIVTDKSEQPFVFNQPNVRVNGIIASTTETQPMVKDLIQHNN